MNGEQKIELTFEEVSHVYKDETGFIYTSATTLIGKYKKPFNDYYWSMYTALKNNGYKVRPDYGKEKIIYVNNLPRSIDSLYSNPLFAFDTERTKDHWKQITEIACDRGNKTHNYLEDTINESKGDVEATTNNNIEPNLAYNNGTKILTEYRTQHDLDATDLFEVYPEIYGTLLFYIKAGCIIYAEKRLYSYYYKLAGTIDVLIVKGKMFAILDWKTNKDKMYFYSGYYKKIKEGNTWVKTLEYIAKDERLLKPLNDLQDCKGILYSLQLSLYATMMIRWGYKLIDKGLMIYHLRPDMRPQLIMIDYKEKEIQSMLDHHYKTRILNNNSNKIKFGIHG
jgi:hypothetical protein